MLCYAIIIVVSRQTPLLTLIVDVMTGLIGVLTRAPVALG